MTRLPNPLCLLLPLLLTGCALIGSGRNTAITIHSPLPTTSPVIAAGPPLPWQLTIARPSAERMIDTARIAVRPLPHELQVYRGAAWSMPATDLVEASVLRVLEDSGRLAGVARSSSGLHSDYRLMMDIRRFESDYAGQPLPTATIEISAHLLHGQTRRIVAARNFLHKQKAEGTSMQEVTTAFQHVLGRSSSEIANWVLAAAELSEHATNARK